jgi:hypothetical protein
MNRSFTLRLGASAALSIGALPALAGDSVLIVGAGFPTLEPARLVRVDVGSQTSTNVTPADWYRDAPVEGGLVPRAIARQSLGLVFGPDTFGAFSAGYGPGVVAQSVQRLDLLALDSVPVGPLESESTSIIGAAALSGQVLVARSEREARPPFIPGIPSRLWSVDIATGLTTVVTPPDWSDGASAAGIRPRALAAGPDGAIYLAAAPDAAQSTRLYAVTAGSPSTPIATLPPHPSTVTDLVVSRAELLVFLPGSAGAPTPAADAKLYAISRDGNSTVTDVTPTDWYRIGAGGLRPVSIGADATGSAYFAAPGAGGVGYNLYRIDRAAGSSDPVAQILDVVEPIGLLVSASPDCPADFNTDGFVDFFDFDDFVACFEGASCPPGQSADFNADGFVDFFDFDDFVAAFDLGC